MTQGERERIVRHAMFSYEEYKIAVKDYEGDILYGTRETDITGIHGGGISDPSAQKGIALIEMEQKVNRMKEWIDVIETGMKELEAMDAGDRIGYKFIATRFYGIPTRRIKQGTVRIAIECHMSRKTVYNRLQTITNVMVFHATKHGLLV